MLAREDISYIHTMIAKGDIALAQSTIQAWLVKKEDAKSLTDALSILVREFLSARASAYVKNIVFETLKNIAAYEGILDKEKIRLVWYKFFLTHYIPISSEAVKKHAFSLVTPFKDFYRATRSTHHFDAEHYLLQAAANLNDSSALSLVTSSFTKINDETRSLVLSTLLPFIKHQELFIICVGYLFDITQIILTITHKENINGLLSHEPVIDIQMTDQAGNNLMMILMCHYHDKNFTHAFYFLLKQPIDLAARNNLGQTIFTCQPDFYHERPDDLRYLIYKLCKQNNVNNLLALPNLSQLLGLRQHKINEDEIRKLKFEQNNHELIIIFENNKTVRIPWRELPKAAKNAKNISAFHYEIAIWLSKEGFPNYLGKRKNPGKQLGELMGSNSTTLGKTILAGIILTCNPDVPFLQIQVKSENQDFVCTISSLTYALVDNPLLYMELREQGKKHRGSDLLIHLLSINTHLLSSILLDDVFLKNYIEDNLNCGVEKWLPIALIIAFKNSNFPLFKQILNIGLQLVASDMPNIMFNVSFHVFSRLTHFNNQTFLNLIEIIHHHGWYRVLADVQSIINIDNLLFAYFKKCEAESINKTEIPFQDLTEVDLSLVKAWLACNPYAEFPLVQFSSSQGNIKLSVSLLTIACVQAINESKKELYNNLSSYQFLPTDLLAAIICCGNEKTLLSEFLNDYLQNEHHWAFLDTALAEAKSHNPAIYKQILDYCLKKPALHYVILAHFNSFPKDMQFEIIKFFRLANDYQILANLFNIAGNDFLIDYFNNGRCVEAEYILPELATLDDLKVYLICTRKDSVNYKFASSSREVSYPVSLLTCVSLKDKVLYNELRQKTRLSHLSHDLWLQVIESNANETLDPVFFNNYLHDIKRDGFIDIGFLGALAEAEDTQKFLIFQQIVLGFPQLITVDEVANFIVKHPELGLSLIRSIPFNEDNLQSLKKFFKKPIARNLFIQYALESISQETDPEYKVDLSLFSWGEFKVYLLSHPDVPFVSLSLNFDIKKYESDISLLTCASLDADTTIYEALHTQKNMKHHPTDLLIKIRDEAEKKIKREVRSHREEKTNEEKTNGETINQTFLDNYLTDMKSLNPPNLSDYLITALLMAAYKNTFDLFDQILISSNDILANTYAEIIRRMVELIEYDFDRYRITPALLHLFEKEPRVECALVAFFLQENSLPEQKEKQLNFEDLFRLAYDKSQSGKKILAHLQTMLVHLPNKSTRENIIDLVCHLFKSNPKNIDQYITQYVRSHPQRTPANHSAIMLTYIDLTAQLVKWNLTGSLYLQITAPGSLLFAKKITLGEHLQKIEKENPRKFQAISHSKEAYLQFVAPFEERAETPGNMITRVFQPH